MGHEVTLGGERLGAGKRNKVWMKDYERSSHDRGYVWRSTMAAGTLVPFMSEIALLGDTFDIHLNCDALTLPTVGPLFGSYKIQLDVFQIPIRLYNGKLHMNMLNIGNDMSKVLLPQVELKAANIDMTKPVDNQQINPSCILSYLGIRGLGWNDTPDTAEVTRQFNALAWLGYWDIYKNYYANKQEGIGAVIHRPPVPTEVTITSGNFIETSPEITLTGAYQTAVLNEDSILQIALGTYDDSLSVNEFWVQTQLNGTDEYDTQLTGMFDTWDINTTAGIVTASNPKAPFIGLNLAWKNLTYDNENATGNPNAQPQVWNFDLDNIDTMRKYLLKWSDDTPFIITPFTPDSEGLQPYTLLLAQGEDEEETMIYSKTFSQEGLGLKTYNSDLFNNWIDTEWIDGEDGISAVTAIDTSGGSFTIDELNMSKKIYDMLNRIAISGGSYNDWLDAVYTPNRQRTAENPIYLGGLIQNLVFQEVVSNAEAEGQPLGTLAGRGTMGNKRKGGSIIAKIDEPSYLLGIISLTPNIDYSQGNKWDTNLKTMNDFHKPALDEIGFQDLITDQMAWFDTELSDTGVPTFKSAGKQPAWINYMTNVNQVRGRFADQTQEMFMTLNRRYNAVQGASATSAQIGDLTTYIDPTKFNHIFADTRRDAQNFWVQIGVNIEARQLISAKVIPNL